MTEKPGDVVEEYEVWCVQVRQEDDHPWSDYGTDREEWSHILRVYDYRIANHPDEQTRLKRTEVKVVVEDPERLRALLVEESERQ